MSTVESINNTLEKVYERIECTHSEDHETQRDLLSYCVDLLLPLVEEYRDLLRKTNKDDYFVDGVRED